MGLLNILASIGSAKWNLMHNNEFYKFGHA
jgi:hypothetical protein